MTGNTNALVLDLIEWVATKPRSYSEVMEAWRTSCPRLTIWEDALVQGFVVPVHEDGVGTVARATPLGLSRLTEEGRLP